MLLGSHGAFVCRRGDERALDRAAGAAYPFGENYSLWKVGRTRRRRWLCRGGRLDAFIVAAMTGNPACYLCDAPSTFIPLPARFRPFSATQPIDILVHDHHDPRHIAVRGGGKFAEIDLGLAVLQKGSMLYSDGRMGPERLALLHPGFEGIERPHAWIKTQREGRARRAGHGIGEDAKPAREPLDVVEQQSGAAGAPRRHFGDCADLELRIGAVDPPQRSELLDSFNELAEVLVHCAPIPPAL